MKAELKGLRRRLALPLLLAGSLVVAGCTGETPTPGTGIESTQPVSATEPVAATDVPTLAATEAPTLAPTEAATEAATEEATTAATQQPAATLEGTAPAAENTPGAGETAMPGVNEAEQVLVQASNLIGLNIEALDGVSVGTIRDVLVDEAGEIQYLVVDVPALAGGQPQSLVVDWSALKTVVNDTNLDDASLEDVKLNFSGNATDLANAITLPSVDDLGAIISSTGTELPAELNNLVSLAHVNTLALQGAADEELGQLQDAFVDLRQGKVDYVVLDLSAVGGAANQTVMVPWEQLTVDPAQAAEAQAFVLDVTQETLRNAPEVDLSNLPTFFDPNQVNWETLQDFWASLS